MISGPGGRRWGGPSDLEESWSEERRRPRALEDFLDRSDFCTTMPNQKRQHKQWQNKTSENCSFQAVFFKGLPTSSDSAYHSPPEVDDHTWAVVCGGTFRMMMHRLRLCHVSKFLLFWSKIGAHHESCCL